MNQSQNNKYQEENDLQKLAKLIQRNYRLFVFCLIIALGLAFLVNRYSIPIYKISSSLIIKESKTQSGSGAVNDYLNSNLFGRNQNFQNELWVLKSSPVLEQTIKNLDMSVTYYKKEGFQYHDIYHNAPFQIAFLPGHPQPVGVRFELTFLKEDNFQLKATSGKTSFYNFETDQFTHEKEKWNFTKNGRLGELIETADLAFIIKPDTTQKVFYSTKPLYGFEFKTVASIKNKLANNLNFIVVDKLATVIEISLKSESLNNGKDIVNELMNVYSKQSLDRKNHIASITIDYIERQLDEISDSLSRTEDNLQSFRSSNQLLNITDQATGISEQYMNLQNQMAELVTRKRYYDYVSGYLLKNDNFANMIVPASLGIQDPLLNNLMSELIAAQAQRSNLVENNQERNPLVQKLAIQIENIKKTISENIDAAGKTTSISIDEMSKRINKIEAEISQLPVTQRLLGNIERKYRLNDAIYNYMMEKRAEAKITKASNLPDDLIIDPAKMVGGLPISPNKRTNYLIALFLGLALPFGYLTIKSALNNKIENQEDMEKLTNQPVLGKILHNRHKTDNVMFEFSNSNIAESFRALRTNLDFFVRGGQKKVIMVTSSMEGEGKTFIAMNIAMSYAQLGRKTILLDFDLRKPEKYFKGVDESGEGLSSYLIDIVKLGDIICKSPHENLDYILSGVLPPNPTELVALGKTEELITHLKNEYDYIILDTPPLGQVTDAYHLINFADVKVIIARYNYTVKKILSLVMKDLEYKNITNTCIVMNDNRFSRDQYGFGYGYDKKGKKRK